MGWAYVFSLGVDRRNAATDDDDAGVPAAWQADNIIPAAETLWMASELPRTQLREALVSPVLSHVNLDAKPGVLDQWRLVHFFALVLHAAERK